MHYIISVDGDTVFGCNTVEQVGDFITAYLKISNKFSDTQVFNFDQVTFSIQLVKDNSTDG